MQIAPQPQPPTKAKKSGLGKGCTIAACVVLGVPLIVTLITYSSCKIQSCRTRQQAFQKANNLSTQDPCAALKVYEVYRDEIRAGQFLEARDGYKTAAQGCIDALVDKGNKYMESEKYDTADKKFYDACFMSRDYNWLAKGNESICDGYEARNQEIERLKKEKKIYDHVMEQIGDCGEVNIEILQKFMAQKGDRFADARPTVAEKLEECLGSLSSDIDSFLQAKHPSLAIEKRTRLAQYLDIVERGIVPGATPEEIDVKSYLNSQKKNDAIIIKHMEAKERQRLKEEKEAEREDAACVKAEKAYQQCSSNCMMNYDWDFCDQTKCKSKLKKWRKACDVPEPPAWL